MGSGAQMKGCVTKRRKSWSSSERGEKDWQGAEMEEGIGEA